MIAALYARVSTNDQDETLQLPRLREAAKVRGMEVFREYSDEATGKNLNRPGWQALRSDAKAHRFDIVIVTKLDRMIRSLSLLLEELEFFHRLKIPILVLNMGIIDLDSSSSRLTVEMLGAVAEWEREIISERTREALAAKKAQGVRLGQPPREIPAHTIALMRWRGTSWTDISKLTGIPRTTILNHRKEIEAELYKIVENPDQ